MWGREFKSVVIYKGLQYSKVYKLGVFSEIMGSLKYTNFDWQMPKVIASLPKGEDAEKLYKAYQAKIQKFPIQHWSRLKYKLYNKEIFHSNNIDAGVINNVLKDSSVRVAVPGDDAYGDIRRLIQGKYYTDFNANVAHKDKPSYEKNNGLWRKVIELAEENKGNVKYPFMIQSFYNLPDKNEKNYGVKIVPARNFKIIEDDRLSDKFSGWKFDNVDEDGLPVGLDKSKGSRTWYTRNDGLSKVFLYGDSDLFASNVNLDYSDGSGRVVLIEDAEGVAPKEVK